jgi:MFS family permease
MDRTLGLGITKGAEFMLWVSVGAYAGYVMFGYWADVYGRRIMFASFTSAMAIMIPIFIWAVSNGGTTILPIVAVVLGFSTGYYGGYGSLYSEQFSTDIRATATSFCLNTGRLANFAGPLLIPWLIPKVGFNLAMGVASLALLLAAIVVMMLKETKGKEITARD